MSFSLAARLAVSALCAGSCAAFFAACDASSANDGSFAGSAGSTAVVDAGADAADAGPAPDSIAFVPATTVTLAPKATQTLKVVTTPPGNFRVRFALLGSGSDSAAGDASLDMSEVETDDTGVAQVTLTASSMPATFTIRASVGVRAQARLGVSVSARNYTTLRVIPSYDGKRQIPEWTATVRSGVTCAELLGNPPPDGDLTATAARGKDLDIEKVPVGVDLAVTLRAGHYIGGCADQAALNEADGNTVLVYASDVPLDLSATHLDVSFGPTSPTSALSKLLGASVIQAETAITGGAASDVTALLDAMRDATPTASREAFSMARQTHAWDTALATAFGTSAATRLRGPADRWFNAGLATFYAADTFAAELGPVAGGALLNLNSVAQIPAATAGFPSRFQATWSADSNDTLLLGTVLSWVPSRLITALAAGPASAEEPGATSVEAALAEATDCALVGKTLLAHGTVVGTTVYESCNEGCAESACVAAIAVLWKNAVSSSGSTSASLTVTGTGPAQVGDDASVTGFVGSWVGQLQVGMDTAPAAGPFTAQATAKAN